MIRGQTRKTGRVYLVGAGPGDPELLTVKALRILKAADVVLHDDLVSREILELAPPHALVRSVGKRCGRKTICQSAIHTLMIDYAVAGLNVVRLQSGDPMIFGRASEEIAALRSAGIQFEIVPGITAALGAAAAAQTPLTQRGVSSAVLLTTYHCAGGCGRNDWQHIAASGATIILYMPGSDYRSISTELCAAGLPEETPCVIASRTSTSQEAVLTTTLGQLKELAALPAPAVLIVGGREVARHNRTQPQISADERRSKLNENRVIR